MGSNPSLRTIIHPWPLAVCRLDPHAEVPSWVQGAFVSITRTPEELSIVCDETNVPSDVNAEPGWRAIQVAGPIPFETTGVAAALTAPLAAAGISVFLIATFDTDYVLVKREVLDRAAETLRAAGHQVT
ncbi:MAG TPA: ACT domain-containing protein [Thermoanaerobaculia bacterium]|nr:ACT domain-containing protein [Thermoanaerobaculia bacterium]